MGEKDLLTTSYMGNKEVFADAVNYALFRGQKKVTSSQLQPIKTDMRTLKSKGRGLLEKRRDVAMTVTESESSNMTYLLIGIENQHHIHFSVENTGMDHALSTKC